MWYKTRRRALAVGGQIWKAIGLVVASMHIESGWTRFCASGRHKTETSTHVYFGPAGSQTPAAPHVCHSTFGCCNAIYQVDRAGSYDDDSGTARIGENKRNEAASSLFTTLGRHTSGLHPTDFQAGMAQHNHNTSSRVQHIPLLPPNHALSMGFAA